MYERPDLCYNVAENWIRVVVRVSVLVWAGAVLVGDLITKQLAMRWLAVGEPLSLLGPIRLNLVYNAGAAFGLLSGRVFWLAGTSLIVMVAMLAFGLTAKKGMIRLAAGAIAGGSAGNLLDRLLRGAVVDFVDVGFWPVFNVADSAIVIGWAMLAWYYVRQEQAERRE